MNVNYTGTTEQATVKSRGQKKLAELKRKHSTYHRHVSMYNQVHRPAVTIADPSFEAIKSLPITDSFWDCSGLSHPNEDWATTPDVKTGIQAFLTKRAASEELCRLAREVRQLISWALDHQARVNDTKPDPAGEFSKN